MAAHNDWHMGMMDNIVTDTTHDGATDSAQSPSSNHNHGSFFLLCCFNNCLSRFATKDSFDFARNLQQNK